MSNDGADFMSSTGTNDNDGSPPSAASIDNNRRFDPAMLLERSVSKKPIFDDNYLPTLTDSRSVEISTSYGTSRRNAATISKQEIQDLLAERATLVDKALDRTISAKEARRLDYVRWSLDRIEDAMHGSDLDEIENVVQQYENFKDDLYEFIKSLKQQRTRK